MRIFRVTVFCTTARPIQVDAQQAHFVIAADSQMDAELTAVDILMTTRPKVQMPTRIVCHSHSDSPQHDCGV